MDDGLQGARLGVGARLGKLLLLVIPISVMGEGRGREEKRGMEMAEGEN